MCMTDSRSIILLRPWTSLSLVVRLCFLSKNRILDAIELVCPSKFIVHSICITWRNIVSNTTHPIQGLSQELTVIYCRRQCPLTHVLKPRGVCIAIIQGAEWPRLTWRVNPWRTLPCPCLGENPFIRDLNATVLIALQRLLTEAVDDVQGI
jgi:hypothetical protein